MKLFFLVDLEFITLASLDITKKEKTSSIILSEKNDKI